jgi:predicted pyridoxine 5'-phosphate oxidase superfamily flavin-nucleotide-binding protein
MTMANNFIELAFTESVRKMQEDYGTRALYEKFEARASPQNILTTREKEFVAHRDAFYLASVGENGWPYLQFRGGPPGFLRVLNGNVLAFADFRGNGQFISAGNFDANGKSVLFLMDYARRKRLKIWAEAVVLRASDHPDILAQVALPDYDASVERIFKFTVEAFDWNCPQHITQRYTLAEVKEAAEIDPDLLRSCCPEKD